MKPTVIYHSADYDGILCREIARKFLGDGADYIGWSYGDPVPKIPSDGNGKHPIYMLDVSVEGLMDYPGLIWIDHHKTAIDKYSKAICGCRIDGVAACRITWQVFCFMHMPAAAIMSAHGLPEKREYIDRLVEEPLAVRLAGEYDVWDHRGDGDLEFQFGLDAQEQLAWGRLLSMADEEQGYALTIVEHGRVVMRCCAKRDADIIRSRSYIGEMAGLKFLCLNTARCNSNTFDAMDVPETGHDALAGFYFDGVNWNISLYHAAHRKDIDLSKIAAEFGGGGHRGACGFRTPLLPIIKK